jgi:hypothetical protein
MAQAFIRRPFIAEARVQSQASPCEIHGGQNGTGIGFSPNTSDFTRASVPSSEIKKSFEVGVDRLSRNVGTELPLSAA